MSTQLDKRFIPSIEPAVNFQCIESADEAGRLSGGCNRFHPEPLRPEEVSILIDDLQDYTLRLDAYEFRYLRVSVDGEEIAIFSPHSTACEPFKVPTTASFLEVNGEDDDGEILLAAFSLTHLDPCRHIEPQRMSVSCGEGQVISIVVSSLLYDGEQLPSWVIKLECAFSNSKVPATLAPLVVVVDGLDTLDVSYTPLWKPLLQPKANPLVRIVVVGLGSSGSNAVDKMIEAGMQGVTFATLNTDLQALQRSHAPTKVQLGSKTTRGLGGGSDPTVGRSAAIESTEDIVEVLAGADMVFITTGMGGGTGTGAAPLVASLAKELGALTVAIVATPFLFEGRRRMRQAVEGINLLRERADTVITLPNERLLHTLHKKVPLRQAFAVTDDALRQAVQSIHDLVAAPGLINLDFAGVRAVMTGMGSAFWGMGRAVGEARALEATHQAISSPMFEETTIAGARSVLINISGGTDLTLHEVNEASTLIHDVTNEDANIIFGATIDEALNKEIRVTILATGSN